MQMNDMVIISVDDHISEPPNMFRRHLQGYELASAPQFHTTDSGADYWTYQGMTLTSVGLNAVVGRVPEEYGMEPQSLAQVRRGCYDPKARIDDMNVNGIAASLNFGSVGGFDGSRCFHKAADKNLALTHLRAYNDWHIQEWCGHDRARFIPCALLPTWNMHATVQEIERIARLGCSSVTLSENPTKAGLPSIHNAYWEPMWKALVEHDITICLHIGSGNAAPHASMETPIEAWITTMPMSIATGAADWLQLDALNRYQDMKIILSESGIGWVPYFLERADFSHWRHKAWTHSGFGGRKPSEVFRKHFMSCFIDDAFGLKNLAEIGEDMVAYECDYPHSDALWPEVPEWLWKSVQGLTDQQIDKVTHLNAMRMLRFDPFQKYAREQLTVGALRARAAADQVDIKPISTGGAAPLAEGETARRITSGDIVKMFEKQARAA
ncbi:Predicted metal-dependent hydrolase, TIM-barrel fold [Solimonas aquatica]|uniref:Predicted metal-dependent hydrolase, TIM-barrel fold n=1 Tax=Solimonas aquatica TaxID=489703 RepID=A0A1H9KB75_9GAMM|nr:amidohydrolase family protein [Solimonas aquatica]SEQ96381.1 Predicted metal-dependent hydrolase, TIM-barrel fold [Solimonas aquatica]